MLDHLQFFRNLKRNTEKGVFILAGPEQYPAKAIVQAIANTIGGGVKVLWGGDFSTGKLIEEVLKHTSAEMFERYTVWVRYLPGEKNALRSLRESLKRLEGVRGVVFSIYENAERLKSLENERVLLVNMRPLNQKEFEAWVLKRFRSPGEKVSSLRKRPDLKALLLENLPRDLREAELEIKKILLYSDRPTRESLNLLWDVEDVRLYEISKRVQEGDVREALNLVQHFQETGLEPSLVLGRLIRDMTNLAYVKLNLSPPFLKKKGTTSAVKAMRYVLQRISEGEMRAVLEELIGAEMAFRTTLRAESRWAYLKLVVGRVANLFSEIPREKKVSRN